MRLPVPGTYLGRKRLRQHWHAMLATTEQVEQTAAWSRYEWIRWGMPYLLAGMALGAIIESIVRVGFK